MKIILLCLTITTSLIMSGCSDSNRRENFKNSLTIILETESVVWGNVSSTWQSGSEKVIKVSYPDQSKNKGGIVYVEIRDKYFRELGYTTVRFSNKEISNNIEEVLEQIKKFCLR